MWMDTTERERAAAAMKESESKVYIYEVIYNVVPKGARVRERKSD